MSNPIVFYNRGELDVRAITTFGLSVKKGDNPIGYFGTGLKYAIAVLLREGCTVDIYSGETQYTFESKKDLFRGEECDLIFMHGDGEQSCQLPFTLELGRNWELWQAYRELYCNALDENGGVCDKHDDPEGREGNTIIVVRGESFATVHRTKNSFINSDAPLMVGDGVEIVPTSGVYLKGIKIASDIYYRPIFGYNFDGGITLTEDRTMKEPIEAELIVKEAFLQSSEHDILADVLLAEEGTFEHQISWSTSSQSMVGETFKKILLDFARNRPSKISESARSLAKLISKKSELTLSYAPTPSQSMAYDKACVFLAGHGVNISDYPVEFVVTLGESVWGQAKNGKILIASECFDYGVKCLVATLYEEHLHLSTGMGDMTRNMQNHLFHTIIGLWEEKDGNCL